MASGSARATIDYEVIRSWVEARGGTPAHVKRTESPDDVGVLRIDFPGYSGEGTLEPLGWDEFFQKFEEKGLAFLYQDDANSRFNKLVSRDGVKLEGPTGSSERDQASAAAGGARSIIDILREDHQRVRALFKETGEAAAEDRERAFSELTAALHAHSQAEQDVVYPALEENARDKSQQLVQKAIAEHQDVERSLTEIEDLGVDDEDFLEQLEDLESSVEAHVNREEGQIFPILEGALDEVDLERLGGEFVTARDEIVAAGDVEPPAEILEEEDQAGA